VVQGPTIQILVVICWGYGSRFSEFELLYTCTHSCCTESVVFARWQHHLTGRWRFVLSQRWFICLWIWLCCVYI